MKEALKRRKNFFPTVIMALIAWIAWVIIFLKVPPATWLSFLFFFLTLSLAFFLTFALLIGNSRRGLLLTLAIIGFLFLRQIMLDSILNLFLLWAALVALEIYLANNH